MYNILLNYIKFINHINQSDEYIDSKDIDLKTINNIIIELKLEIDNYTYIYNKICKENFHKMYKYISTRFMKYWNILEVPHTLKYAMIAEFSNDIASYIFQKTRHYYKIDNDGYISKYFFVTLYKSIKDLKNKKYSFSKKLSLNESGFEELYNIMLAHELYSK